MATKTIYRVEHKDTKQGPYCGMLMTRLSNAHNGSMLHPSLTLDARDSVWRENPIEWPNEGYRTGMFSISAIAEWFKGWGAELARAKYQVVHYEVKEENILDELGEQVIFIAQESHYSEIISWT